MNLQENIYRIQGLMVTEGKSGTIDNMIKKLGLYDTIQLIGGYDRLKRMIGDTDIPRKEKINGIIERVRQINKSRGEDDTEGIWISDFDDKLTIEYDGAKNDGTQYDYQQIEVFYIDGVYVYGYIDKYSFQNVGSFEVEYEELSDEELDNVFKFMMR
jgi:hypothetical protein